MKTPPFTITFKSDPNDDTTCFIDKNYFGDNEFECRIKYDNHLWEGRVVGMTSSGNYKVEILKLIEQT